MKKFVIALLSLTVSTWTAFAQDYTVSIGAGIAFPFNFFDVDGADIKETQTDFSLTGLAINKTTNLALAANLNIGKPKSKGDKGIEGIVDSVVDFGLLAGIGYAPVHNEQFTVAILGTLGFDMSYYTGDYEYTKPVTMTVQHWQNEEHGTYYTEETIQLQKTADIYEMLFYFTIGANFLCQYHINKTISLFGSFGLYYDIGTFYTDVNAETSTTSNTSLTGWSVVPQIGLCITLPN